MPVVFYFHTSPDKNEYYQLVLEGLFSYEKNSNVKPNDKRRAAHHRRI